MKRRTTAAAIFSAIVALVTMVGTVFGACDPGRASVAAYNEFGSIRTAATSDTHIWRLEGSIDNEIPFMESGSSSHAILEMRYQSSSKPNARAFIALRWNQGQTSKANTHVRVYISNEAGTGTTFDDDHWLLGNLTSDLDSPRLQISVDLCETCSYETYRAKVNNVQFWSATYYLAGQAPSHFRKMRVLSTTSNNGNQVPGVTGNHERFVSIEYESNYGVGTYYADSTYVGEAWGSVSTGAGYTHTWDKWC